MLFRSRPVTRKRKMLLFAGIPAGLLLGLTLVLLFFAATGPGLATLVWLAQKLGGGTLALESGQGFCIGIFPNEHTIPHSREITETLVGDIYHIDRGYHDLVGKLKNLGANIERIND